MGVDLINKKKIEILWTRDETEFENFNSIEAIFYISSMPWRGWIC